VALVLGDNIFYGHGLGRILSRCSELKHGGIIFGYLVKDPERYGVVEFDKEGKATDIQEKPKKPRSRYAVPGLYFYDGTVAQRARSLKPSTRGELEITDLNREYLRSGELKVEIMGRGFAWLDTGTHESLQQASSFVRAIQERQGLKIACVEEIAYQLGYIGRDDLKTLASDMIKNEYGQYLMAIAEADEGRRGLYEVY